MFMVTSLWWSKLSAGESTQNALEILSAEQPFLFQHFLQYQFLL